MGIPSCLLAWLSLLISGRGRVCAEELPQGVCSCAFPETRPDQPIFHYPVSQAPIWQCLESSLLVGGWASFRPACPEPLEGIPGSVVWPGGRVTWHTAWQLCAGGNICLASFPAACAYRKAPKGLWILQDRHQKFFFLIRIFFLVSLFVIKSFIGSLESLETRGRWNGGGKRKTTLHHSPESTIFSEFPSCLFFPLHGFFTCSLSPYCYKLMNTFYWVHGSTIVYLIPSLLFHIFCCFSVFSFYWK